MAEWIGPGHELRSSAARARVGGATRSSCDHRRSCHPVLAPSEVDRPKRIVFTWKWEGTTPTPRDLTMRDLAGKTELTLRHEGLRPSRTDMKGTALNKLVAFLARGETPPKA